MSYMYGVCCVPFLFSKNRLSKILFSNPFPKKRSDCESQKSGFGFDPKNPLRVWILWIHDPLFDLPPKNAKSGFGFGNPDLDFPQKTHPLTLLREENDSKQLDEIQAKSHLRFSESPKVESKIGYVCRMKDEFPVGTFQDYLFRSSIRFRNFLERLLYRLYTHKNR